MGNNLLLQQQMKRAKQKTPMKKVRNKRAIYSLARKKKEIAAFQCANGGHTKGGNGFLHEEVTTYHTRFTAMPDIATSPVLEIETPKKDDGVLLRLREDYQQAVLDIFDEDVEAKEVSPKIQVIGHTSNFLNNMRLPIHRWFRYSAGFSAEWVKWLLAERDGSELRVLDPFVGSGTTCLACDEMGVPSYGIEAHPFVYRVAQAKLNYATDPERFISKAERAFAFARKATAQTEHYPDIIGKCYGLETLGYLDRFRQAVEFEHDGSPEAGLLWMALVSSLRAVSEAGTAPWQYVLPGRRKTIPPPPEVTLHKAVQMIVADIRFMARRARPLAKLQVDDARKCATVPDGWATLVITSPPYANNYDYADATRLEMAFMGEIRGWGDLQETVRRHLVRACSQHVPPNSVNLDKSWNRQNSLPSVMRSCRCAASFLRFGWSVVARRPTTT